MKIMNHTMPISLVAPCAKAASVSWFTEWVKGILHSNTATFLKKNPKGSSLLEAFLLVCLDSPVVLPQILWSPVWDFRPALKWLPHYHIYERMRITLMRYMYGYNYYKTFFSLVQYFWFLRVHQFVNNLVKILSKPMPSGMACMDMTCTMTLVY